MSKTPRIVVAMPAFNEEAYIGTMVLRSRRYADEVIVVDDGSSDKTAQVAALAGATVVKHGDNRGYGATIQTILAEGANRQLDVLVLLDADVQHNPDDIPHMCQPIINGYDLVIGRRARQQIPLYRYVGQQVLSLFTRGLTRNISVDSQSGFRAFSPRALRELHPKETGMAVSSEVVGLATKIGLNITEVAVSVRYTKDSSTLNPVMQGTTSLARIIAMISKRRPLLFFGGGGLTGAIAGFFVGIKGYQMFMTNQILPVGTMLAATLLIVLGTLSIFTGVILNAMPKE